MKHCIYILFYILFFYFNCYSQTSSDYKTDSLFVVWGKKDYTGREDCSAKVTINSDGKSINISVEVLDDILVLNSDPINSDHIELWFCLPELYDNDFSSSKFIISDSSLYLIDGSPDLDKFKSFLLDPLIKSYDSGIDSFYFSQIKDSLGEDYYNWLKESIDTYFKDAKSSKLYVNNFPFGIVHYGLFPNYSTAIQYDTSLYVPLKKFTKIKLDDLTKYIKYSKEITINGYKFHITINPKALGFVSKYGVNKLRFLVDIVDVDLKKKQETLLSTSKNRIWFEPTTFNKTTFKKRINIPILENIKPIGQEIAYETPYEKLKQFLSKYFVKSVDGWAPIDIQDLRFYEYNQPEVYVIEGITKIRIKKGILKYSNKTIGNNLVEHIKCSSGEFVILNKNMILSKKGIIKTISLPDSNIAFLFSDYEITGRYTKSLLSYLYLIADHSKQLIASYLYGYPPSIRIASYNKYKTLKQNYRKLDWDGWSDQNVKWENVIEYENKNQFLLLSFSDSLKYKIKWDRTGKIIEQY